MHSKILLFLDKNIKYIFIAPAVIFVLAMILFPLLYNFRLSTARWSLSAVQSPEFVGLANYWKLFTSSRFWDSVLRTLYFSGVGLLLQILFGLAMAIFVQQKFILKKTFKTLLLVPMVITPVAVGMVWLLIYEPTIGMANYLLALVGLPPQEWLGSTAQALWALVAIDVWQWTPMVAVIIIAGLSTLPVEPYESARIDGASRFQILWKITLPLISPSIFVAGLLRLIDILKTFDIIYSTTQGGPGSATETINIYGYLLSFQYFRFGEAAATLVFFLIFIVLISYIVMRIRNKFVVEL